MWGWMIFGWVIFGVAFMMALQADTDKQLPKVSQLPLEEQERLLQAERAAAKKKQIQHIGLWGTWLLFLGGLISGAMYG